MYRQPAAWRMLLDKLIVVLREYAAQQVNAGADAIQIFDSWAGRAQRRRLSRLRCAAGNEGAFVREVQASRRSCHLLRRRYNASLLPRPCARPAPTCSASIGAFRSTQQGGRSLDYALRGAGQSRSHSSLRRAGVDPPTRVHQILAHGPRTVQTPFFNLGHGIVHGTPVENVQAVVKFVREYSLLSPIPSRRSWEALVADFAVEPIQARLVKGTASAVRQQADEIQRGFSR